MIHVVLYEPEIPPNTGNIARTCAATGTPLHLIEPLAFSLAEKEVRRAGLDYWDALNLTVHRDWANFCSAQTVTTPALFSTRGRHLYTELFSSHGVNHEGEDLYLVFGPETRGLPDELIRKFYHSTYRIPMAPEFRSLNLSNTVALVLYEGLRSRGFPGLL